MIELLQITGNADDSVLLWILSVGIFPLIGVVYFHLIRWITKIEKNLGDTKGKLFERLDSVEHRTTRAEGKIDGIQNGIAKDLHAIRDHIENELKNAQNQKDYFESRLTRIEDKVDKIIENRKL